MVKAMRFVTLLATAALQVLSLSAAAQTSPNATFSVGTMELQHPGNLAPITLFYPSAASEATVTRGPFTMRLANRAEPVRGNGRLIVFSHGSGGSPWPMSDLARTLVQAGFIVAIPEHEGDNYKSQADAGPVTWKRRPLEISQTIDALQADTRFAPLFDASRVGVYGTSAGGHAVLTLAGGRWSPARFRDHCLAHLEADFPGCVGLAVTLSDKEGSAGNVIKIAGARTVHRLRFGDETLYQHDEPRIKAAVASMPMVTPFDLASLAQPRVPLAILPAGHDAWLIPRFHAEPLVATCKTCSVMPLPTAGHGSLLSPWPADLARSITPMLLDPPGFDRQLVAEAYARIAAFFSQHLR
jgi:predicted dienelactone hydrolase